MSTDLMDTTRTYARATWQIDPVERARWLEGPGRPQLPYKAVGVVAGLGFALVVFVLVWDAVKGAPL